jgi:hypothetical protein
MRGRLGNSGLGSANEHGLPEVNGKPALNGSRRNRLREGSEKPIQQADTLIQTARNSIQETATLIPNSRTIL